MKKLLLLLAVRSLIAVAIPLTGLCDDSDRVIRDENGKIIARIEQTANGKRIRDNDGKIIGTISSTPSPSPAQSPKP